MGGVAEPLAQPVVRNQPLHVRDEPGAVVGEQAGLAVDDRLGQPADRERRGLTDRVRLHGHVSEEEKRRLYRHAWLNMTASSAEGWCLTVMEAAASGTPSAALAVGGLPESIVDGETGMLAHDRRDLAEKTRAVLDDEPLRRRLGETSRKRAQEFTWDATAQRTLEVLRAERDGAPGRRPGRAAQVIERSAPAVAAALTTRNRQAAIALALTALAITVRRGA